MAKRKHRQSDTVIHAVTHIPLRESNPVKLDALNAVADVYLKLCQAYTIYFCQDAEPDGYAAPHLPSELSQRWQRVAMMQAAGIAQSWRSNRNNALAAYERRKQWFEQQYPTAAEREANASKAPQWREFNLPELKQMKIEANRNVAQLSQEDELPLELEAARGSGFDYWLRLRTLNKREPIWLPVQLADYHRKKLGDQQPNSSVTLERRKDGTWWLTLTVDAPVVAPQLQAQAVGVDVGINHFITTSTGQHYGTFQGDLNARFEGDRSKRQRKAKLRAVLEQKGVEKLPSTTSASGERLRRHTRQSINKAVKDFFLDHPNCEIVLEDLSVSTMRFKSKRMNAKLHASNLAQTPNHIHWVAAQLGLPVTKVNPAYSSQECKCCHFVHRNNRPNQQTFCCQVCGYAANADEAAALNLVQRLHDNELLACQTRNNVKELLLRRHQLWRTANGYP
jgi:IS605 OrfB family transposase